MGVSAHRAGLSGSRDTVVEAFGLRTTLATRARCGALRRRDRVNALAFLSWCRSIALFSETSPTPPSPLEVRLTRCWREEDSNPRSLTRSTRLEHLCHHRSRRLTSRLAFGDLQLGLAAIKFIDAPALHLGIEHFQGSAAGVDLVVMGVRFHWKV